MFFKRFGKFFALLTVIIVLLSITTFAVARQGVIYTALGDSIAYGTGATDGIGYTDMLNTHFERKYGTGTYINLSADGVTSSELLGALLHPTDIYGVQSAVYAADIITISIGGNDLLGPFVEAMGDVIFAFYLIPDNGWFAIDYEALLSDLAEWEMDPSTQPQFNQMLYDLAIDLPGYVADFAINWGQIIHKVRLLNPDADIYVNTVYNPLKFSPILNQFADPAIQGLNLPIWGYAATYDYKVVDVYSKFALYNNPKKLAEGDLSTLAQFSDPEYNGPVPFHPTDMGYKFIFNMHKELMD